MANIEQKLHIEDDAFLGMRQDANKVMQKLIENMVEKETLEGSVTIKIDVKINTDYILNMDETVSAEHRKVMKPQFSHKVDSVMQVKDEMKGGTKYDGMELVYDEVTGEYVLKPIINTEQQTIFDDQYREIIPDDNNIATSPDGDFMNVPLIEGEVADETALKGPTADENDADDEDDYGYDEPEE